MTGKDDVTVYALQSLFENFNFRHLMMQPKSFLYVACTMEDPDLELRAEGWWPVLLALTAFLP